MQRLHALKLIAGGLVAAATALGTGASLAQTRATGDGGTVRIMISPAGTMGIAPAVIKKYELDKKHGFNLEVVSYSDQKSATAAIQSRSAEMVVFDWLATARLRASGTPVVGIAPFLTYVNSVIVPRDSKLNTLADLKGKRVGVAHKTGFDWVIMQAAAEKLNKMDLGRDVEVREGAVPLLRGLMEKGDLDATQMWNSLAPEMLASGKYRTMVTIRELTQQMGLPTVPFLMFSMREDYAKQNPGNARAFVAAYREAADILMKNEEVWLEHGARLKLSPESLAFFKEQVRRDLLKSFTPDMSKGLTETLGAINAVAADVVGLGQMPAGLLTLEYQ
ncbi:ABC transporter substrate-binding protein [Hydrogenophaga laconesensis]|uniref:NitT/TauT family transport system substrate-binding protein n=1 Tax=Hydrogenophaga laconesensis TaxID=1805971 RepID=A0ABU1V7W5_9BURK|nr:ABC transporter substrate-binding protein [Hydrogenophaga laconesensis]MDR7093537.1 NitT/TauT family transport system substrate-binding protein [Hydrogenophaga laconesensis]